MGLEDSYRINLEWSYKYPIVFCICSHSRMTHTIIHLYKLLDEMFICLMGVENAGFLMHMSTAMGCLFGGLKEAFELIR